MEESKLKTLYPCENTNPEVRTAAGNERVKTGISRFSTNLGSSIKRGNGGRPRREQRAESSGRPRRGSEKMH